MTRKKNDDEKKKESSKKNAPKLILKDAVEACEYPEYTIKGALSLAGLLDDYEYQKRRYLKEEFKPSITMDELNEIINEFLGE